MKYQKGVLQNRQTTVGIFTRLADSMVILASSVWLALYFMDSTNAANYLAALIAMMSFYAICELQHFYVSWRTTPFRMEAWRLTLNWLLAFLVASSADSMLDFDMFSSIWHQLTWFVATWCVLLLYRRLLKALLHTARGYGYNTRKVAIVGSGRLGQELAKRIKTSPWMGFNIVGHYDIFEYVDSEHTDSTAHVLGDLEQLVSDAKDGIIDRVYIALPVTKQSYTSKLVNDLADTTCSVMYLPDVFTFELLHARSDNLGGLPVISIYSSPMDGSNRILKRAFDLVVGSLILLLISVPMLVIAFAVKVTSKGPVFFKQNRYGIDGQAIKVWKFRSMNVMENGDKVTQAKKGDNRLTPIGGFLRSTSLDELPQFINVIQGSMSIVGPRPHAVAHNEEYRKLINGYMLRHLVKPGITGWAQINGWRGETDTLDKMEKRIEFDLDYIRNWSVFFDAKIVFLTIFKGFIDKNAY
ncbi:undecaprenyl-phosphate glucose phosphotransferase [Vibrio fortis]|uniref:Undecaprenyl-phosphate glucose phosphotransferase n=1 Tax=Vibrio fortis TaxID=212667 RepID=A0A5N3S7M7_9VIBR|nr:undecaprenyl-phosphate glucose phosphotransferase [Vibrio fortis]KAB0302262.1 undecaprenyl-phosphate glucose phosphotransferase [Vibrio fortis]